VIEAILSTSISWIFPEAETRRLPFFGVLCVVLLSAGSVLWWHGSRVLFSVDGKARHVATKSERVSDFLVEQHIVLGPKDFVTPPANSLISRNEAIRVTRVIERPVDVRHWTPPAVHSELRTTANLRGVLAQRGYAIETTDTFLTTFYDGKEAKRRKVATKTIHQPFYRLTLYDAKGELIKTYDLLKARNMKTVATGYYVGDPLVPGDETYLGYKMRRGLVAVDPKVIPLHSRLYIPGYGYGYAADTGSRIKQNRIDLAVKDRHEERRYMHRPMTVYVLEEAPRW
jgi:3D (Asp-Asp-Asp) domain-containing protein